MTADTPDRRSVAPWIRSRVWAELTRQREVLAGTLALQLDVPVGLVEIALETNPKAHVTHTNALGIKVWGIK